MALNKIATEEKAEIIAANLKAECPVIELCERKIENGYEGGGGDTVSVKTVDYGFVYKSTNGDMTDKDMTTGSIKTPVRVDFMTNPVELESKDHNLNLEDFDIQIVRPRISLLASQVNEDVIGTGIRAASNAIVLTTPNDAKFGVLARMIAMVKQSRVGDRIGGVISPSVEAIVADNGSNQFGSHQTLGMKMWDGKVKTFGGINWITSSDVPMLENPQAIAGATLVAPITNGAKFININFTGAVVLKKYTPFTIAGINMVDAYGKNQAKARTFIVAADVTSAGGNTSVPVAPVWWSRDEAFGLKNASSAGVAGAKAEFPLAAKTYYVGGVWASKAVAFASLKPAALEGGVVTAGSNVDGVNVLMTAQANATKFRSVHRWDVLVGSEPIYQQGACGLYVPVE